MNLFFDLQTGVGAFLGVIQAFIGGIVYDGSPFDGMERYTCCAKLSRLMEVFDARSSSSVLDAMRATSALTLNSDEDSEIPELGHDGNRLEPNVFEGIWWMDGNPAAEILVTMADAFYPADATDSREIRGPSLDVEGGTWAYANAMMGRMLFVTQCVQDIRPQFLLNETATGLLYQGGELDRNVMTYIDEHTYTKKVLRGLRDYTLRRIIDADGVETANWDIWLEKTKNKRKSHKLLTYRRRDTDETCHYDFLPV